jgi:hypothetical protein
MWLGTMIALSWAGCASEQSTHVDNAKLGRLSEPDRQAIIQSENDVNVARSNVTTLQSSVDEAKRFQSVAAHQIDAAKASEAAANDADKLAQRAGGAMAQIKAAQMKRRATAEMAAAKARKDFADRMIDLRNAQLDEAKARVDAAQAQVEQTKMIKARGNGQDIKNADAIEKATRQADDKVTQAHQKSTQQQALADLARQNWEQKQAEFNLAAAQPVIQPPPPASLLPPPSPPQERP